MSFVKCWFGALIIIGYAFFHIIVVISFINRCHSNGDGTGRIEERSRESVRGEKREREWGREKIDGREKKNENTDVATIVP